MSNVCLESLEALNTVMECSVSWVQFKGLISVDDGSLPASIVHIVIYVEHVVSGKATESILMIGRRLGFQHLALLELKIFRL
jgi:hypothetical protein